jgi:hypothetical protein
MQSAMDQYQAIRNRKVKLLRSMIPHMKCRTNGDLTTLNFLKGLLGRGFVPTGGQLSEVLALLPDGISADFAIEYSLQGS